MESTVQKVLQRSNFSAFKLEVKRDGEKRRDIKYIARRIIRCNNLGQELINTCRTSTM